MYLNHFELKELPFTITPDTDFFMNRAGYQDALNVLLVALRSGEGFIKVTGEVGVGKTILCRKLLNSLGAGFVSAYVHNPYLKPDSLMFNIADELEIAYPEGISQNALLKLLTQKLLELHNGGRRVVICLDEVQAMPLGTLEALRLLTNLETEKRKLVQVVLFGQPELESVLSHPSIRQLKQRITYSYKLLPLNRTALSSYVRHRLLIAGYRGQQLFPEKVMKSLYEASHGIPRLINIICHKALIAAYGEGVRVVKPRHMQVAINDTLQAQAVSPSRGLGGWAPSIYRWIFGSIAVMAVGTMITLQLMT